MSWARARVPPESAMGCGSSKTGLDADGDGTDMDDIVARKLRKGERAVEDVADAKPAFGSVDSIAQDLADASGELRSALAGAGQRAKQHAESVGETLQFGLGLVCSEATHGWALPDLKRGDLQEHSIA